MGRLWSWRTCAFVLAALLGANIVTSEDNTTYTPTGDNSTIEYDTTYTTTGDNYTIENNTTYENSTESTTVINDNENTTYVETTNATDTEEVSTTAETVASTVADSTESTGQTVTSTAADSTESTGQTVTSTAADSTESTGQTVTSTAADSTESTGQTVTSTAAESTESTGQTVTSTAADSTESTGQTVTSTAADSTESTGQTVTSTAADSTESTGQTVTSTVADNTESTGQTVTSTAADSTESTGQTVTSTVADNTESTGQTVTSTVADNTESTGQTVTSTAADNTQSTGQTATSTAADNTQSTGQTATSTAADNTQSTGQTVSSTAADNTQSTGQTTTITPTTTTTTKTTTTIAATVIAEYPSTMRLDFNASDQQLNESSTEYADLKKDLESTLSNKMDVPGLLKVEVRSMSKGSLILDTVLSVNKTANPNAAGAVVNAFLSLASTGIPINNVTYGTTVAINGIAVDTNTDKCLLLNQTEPCKSNFICVKNSNNTAECQEVPTTVSVTSPTPTTSPFSVSETSPTPTTTPFSGKCAAGTGFSWLSGSCVACSADEYNDGTNMYCLYCQYTTTTKTSCNPSGIAKTIKQIDFSILIEYSQTKCQLSDTLYTSGALMMKNNFISKNPKTELCQNLPNCDNIIIQIKQNNLCKLGSTCSSSSNCKDFTSTATIEGYNVPEFTKAGNGDMRKTVETVLESFSNLTLAAANFSDYNIKVNFPPLNFNVTYIPSTEMRKIYISATIDTSFASQSELNDFLNANAIKEITQLTPSFLYSVVETSRNYTDNTTNLPYTSFNASLVFKTAITTTLVNAVAQACILSHKEFSGTFGDSPYAFVNAINIFNSQASRTSGTSAILWCAFLQNLQSIVSFQLCNLDTSCSDSDKFFSCVSTEDPSKVQKLLYPYGPGNGDKTVEHVELYGSYSYTNKYYSEKIRFASGAPFGSRNFKEAKVWSNGALTFGSDSYAWYPFFQYSSDNSYYANHAILAAFWFDTNYLQTGKVYYQLYEKLGSNGASNADIINQVLNRSSYEVMEMYKLSSYSAVTCLIATYENVAPYNWYSWICEYYQTYKNESWWQYYDGYYKQYCNKAQVEETNTFQVIYVTDGTTAYAITMYKKGSMNWLFENGRAINVGFQNDQQKRDYGVTYTDLTTKLDKITWNTGRYGTWIEKVGQVEDPDNKCQKFYLDNLKLKLDSQHQKYINALYDCPCSMDRLGRQWWYYSWNEAEPGKSYYYCFAIGTTAKTRLLTGNPLNKLCCYLYTPPTTWWDWKAYQESLQNAHHVDHTLEYGSHLLLNDPWLWGSSARNSLEQDMNPHRWCCVESSSPSKYCALFDEVRPDVICSIKAEYVSGQALGDPHIVTLDGKKYTFNGRGEYFLIKTDDFVLQARTAPANTSKDVVTNATVFVAFAAKDGNATFQVELDFTYTGMIISANGADITRDFYATEDYQTQSETGVTVTRSNSSDKIKATAAFPTGFSFEVYVGMENLEFAINVPNSYQNKTKGLLGVFNKDPKDDFTLPDGTVLTEEQTNTERKISENFGNRWTVSTTTSVFKYAEGESAITYQFPDFTPFFMDEVNQTLVNATKVTCGGNDACTFDLLVTGNEAFALSTKSTSQQADAVQLNLANNLPVLSLGPNQVNSNNQLLVTHGKSMNIQFNATDADKDSITFSLIGTPQGVSINNVSGVVTYLPDSTKPVAIGVQAKDSKGGLSAILYLNIVVCPYCSGNGSCNVNRIRANESEGGKFLVSVCDCWPAYTGDDCEREVNGCLTATCAKGQDCVDLSAAEQNNNTIGYKCQDCPAGFQQRGSTCADINECIVNGSSPAPCPDNSNCFNSVGSYSCQCDLGYRLDSANKNQCNDVDECAERTHQCDQICKNTEGSYECQCYGGYKLNSNNKTCDVNGTAATCSLPCAHLCVTIDDKPVCQCRSGYKLKADNSGCEDIDECSSGNKPCSQACQNTVGSFKCSCYAGFKMDTDGVSCKKCDSPYYGVNCASQCICNGLGTCDNVRGCQCKAGWSGTNCNIDVNECLSDVCPVGQVCTNTLGSYTCTCPPGYTMNKNACEDNNECLSVLTHNCSLSVEDCVNNIGSYSCMCRDGYARNANKVCEDIDECSKGTHNCEQVCENAPGQYNCKCRYGYRLDTDRASCVKQKDVCAGLNMTCDQICTLNWETNTPYCACNAGFDLVGGKTCVDINECKLSHLNLCSYQAGCINTNGSFNCSCPSGSMLDNDKRTCISCGSGKWGLECANDCSCSSGASSCDPKRGCICKSGFTGTLCEKDVDECATGQLTCPAKEKCNNTIGSAACVCLDGYQRLTSGCEDINECANIATNDCDQLCDNYEGGYSCSCNKGYSYDKAAKSCKDIDECQLNIDGCQEGCENSDGGFRCACPTGLALAVDGVSCIVASTCTTLKCQYDCYKNTSSIEICFCQRGKEVDLKNTSACIDVNMCVNNRCNETCTETADGTSYTCSCNAGKKLAKDGLNCEDCLPGTYGNNCESKCNCIASNTETCNKVNGSCTCKAGWTSDNCATDKDECQQSGCSSKPNSDCINTPGSYICQCKAGYYNVNGSCTACVTGTYGKECLNQCLCDPSHSTCDKATGNCTCESGWNGTHCDTDADECTIPNNCTAANISHWLCFNTPGSYKCDCDKGFESKNGTCVDQDECAASSTNECDQNCTNTDGSYTCTCGSGYTLDADKHSCKDVDECVSSPCQQVCENSLGSYSCSCKDGFYLDTDNKTCYESGEYDATIKLEYDVTDAQVLDEARPEYKELKQLVEKSLFEAFKSTIRGLIGVIVKAMRKGSLVADFTTIVNKVVNPDAASAMVEAIVQVVKTGITIDNQTYTTVVTFNGFTVNSSTVNDKCAILN
ncbi:mucin-4-like [Physella acuta]|uniref:mucin-4-like n=1 Tax=Physella acuta TaxID=109671 RepID=UPI0027DB05D4|nr:mucin-4-like [Physella acuta]